MKVKEQQQDEVLLSTIFASFESSDLCFSHQRVRYNLIVAFIILSIDEFSILFQ